MYISRVSSRQTTNFGFGQSSQSHLRLTAVISIGFSHPKARYFLVATRKYPKKRSPGSAAANTAAALAPAFTSGGPPKGHPCPCGGRGGSFPRPLRARSSSALGAQLDQGGPKKTLHIKPLTSNVRRPGLRLRPSLGLSKGDKKNQNSPFRPNFTFFASLSCFARHVRRGGNSLDRRLLSGSSLGASFGESRQQK